MRWPMTRVLYEIDDGLKSATVPDAGHRRDV